VYRFNRVRIVSGNANLCTSDRVTDDVTDFAVQPLHRFCPWRQRIMDEHGNRKVTTRELCRDQAQVVADRLLALDIGWIFTDDFDRPTIREEMKVMGRLLVTETHRLVAPGIYARKMVLRTRGRRLAFCP
jgi:hypothetical protein